MGDVGLYIMLKTKVHKICFLSDSKWWRRYSCHPTFFKTAIREVGAATRPC